MNEAITSPEVRLIGQDGEKIGVVSLQEALDLSIQAEMDLVEVAPNAEPPVCRIVNYKKLQYEKQRKQKEARKNQRHVETKEVKLRPNIGQHDYDTKLNRLRDFLMKGFKVKVTLIFRQRELRRYDVGQELIARMVKDVKDIASRENSGRGQHRAITLFLVPCKEVMLEVERLHKEEMEHRKEEHEKRLERKHGSQASETPESPEVPETPDEQE